MDAAGIRVRARALARLIDGTRWRVTPWHGSWVVTDPAGRQRHAPDLDAVFRILPTIAPAVAATEPGTVAEEPVPPGWHVQAALVWVGAARAAGIAAELTLPAVGGPGLAVRVGPAGVVAHVADGVDRVVVRAPGAAVLLASLLQTASSSPARERSPV
jgi:hypothetical protein